MDGAWGTWDPWSQCTVTCGGGQQRRYRACDRPAPQGGGSECRDPDKQYSVQDERCNTQICTYSKF